MKRTLLAYLLVIILAGGMLAGCVNTDELQKLLTVQVDDASLYTPNSYDAYLQAVEDAKAIVDKSIVSGSKVKAATKSLQDSIDGLTLRADKTKLIRAKDDALAINTDLYLPVSCTELNNAISIATTIIGDDNATQEDVNTAIQRIDTVIAALEEKPDKTALSNLIRQAKSFKEEKYTTASYNALKDAIPDAEKVYKNNNATQSEVTAATTTLQKIIGRLKISTKCVWLISPTLRKTATNHVGDDWSSGVFYNEEQVRGNFEVTAQEGVSITIIGKAIEHDNVPDVGSGSLSLVLGDGNVSEITFYVRENRGRYSGNCAVWVLVVSCELIERV